MLRPFQLKLKADALTALAEIEEDFKGTDRHACVLCVLPTGGGKTRTMTDIMEETDGPQAAIAHRSELIGQISLDLARQGIYHDIVGSDSTKRDCRLAHLEDDEVGHSFIRERADVRVCSIDTLNKHPLSDPWLSRVRRWHGDEGHHFLRANKWGKGVARFSHSQGILWTATPIRADGKGLGRHSDGLADRMILGPGQRDMINMGYLTDYDLISPEIPDLDLQEVDTGSTGDFVFEQLRVAIKKSKKLAGDVVDRYLEFTPGKRAIVFAVDVEEASRYAESFRLKGVRAEVVTGKTPPALRRQILNDFRAGRILVLVNVDLFGEGFDVPACEVVIMARPTWSFSLYAQQFGRSLRLMIEKALSDRWGLYSDADRLAFIAGSSKPVATVIDLVGNWMRNHLPDWIGHMPSWTLDRRAARSQVPDDAIPLTRCTNAKCLRPYERHLGRCPHCGNVREISGAGSRIEQVDGAVFRLSPEALHALRTQVDGNMRPPTLPPGLSAEIHGAAAKRHREKVQEIRELQIAMGAWCQWFNTKNHAGHLSDEEQMKAFFFTFGIDTLSAQGLDRAKAHALREKVLSKLAVDNAVINLG